MDRFGLGGGRACYGSLSWTDDWMAVRRQWTWCGEEGGMDGSGLIRIEGPGRLEGRGEKIESSAGVAVSYGILRVTTPGGRASVRIMAYWSTGEWLR